MENRKAAYEAYQNELGDEMLRAVSSAFTPQGAIVSLVDQIGGSVMPIQAGIAPRGRVTIYKYWKNVFPNAYLWFAWVQVPLQRSGKIKSGPGAGDCIQISSNNPSAIENAKRGLDTTAQTEFHPLEDRCIRLVAVTSASKVVEEEDVRSVKRANVCTVQGSKFVPIFIAHADCHAPDLDRGDPMANDDDQKACPVFTPLMNM